MRILISVILGLAILGGAFFLFQNLSDSKKAPVKQNGKSVNAVFVTPAENLDLPIMIETNGTIKAQERIELYTEVQGVLLQGKKPFKPGQRYKKGELLLAMDSKEFYSSLLSQRSNLYNSIVTIMPDLKFDLPESFDQWQKYLDEFDINQNLKPLPAALNEKEKYFINAKQIVATYYNIKNLEERLQKYQITAPFSGILTEALVDPGTLVRTGQKLGSLINPSVFELEANINSDYLDYLRVGKRVTVTDLAGEKRWTGFVKRVNGIIDPTTQTVQAFIQISGAGLTEGMFLEAEVTAQTESNVLEIDRSLLTADNSVFVVHSDTVLVKKPVEVVNFTDKRAMIRGLENGELMLSKPLPGAFDGMIVSITNQE
ncbi:efflux RND transporter periplasmic adaptor subunit [Jiulongibacter sp. NS-SX5]|uniref:efflux RND transporter periplasmic adaptor subunit n=1 Tax=Jiulongibacter sp. NS-SX5 TaxID=3463854 RepID=UPI004059BCF4